MGHKKPKIWVNKENKFSSPQVSSNKSVSLIRQMYTCADDDSYTALSLKSNIISSPNCLFIAYHAKNKHKRTKSGDVFDYDSPIRVSNKPVFRPSVERLSKANLKTLHTMNTEQDSSDYIEANHMSRIFNLQTWNELYDTTTTQSTNMTCFSYIQEETWTETEENYSSVVKDVQKMAVRTMDVQTKSSHDSSCKRFLSL